MFLKIAIGNGKVEVGGATASRSEIFEVVSTDLKQEISTTSQRPAVAVSLFFIGAFI